MDTRGDSVDVLGRIDELMRRNGWSEYKLAKVSGVPQSTINSLYRKNNLPTIPTLENLCKAFDITLSEFFADGKNIASLTHEQRVMFEKWKDLPNEQKELLMRLIDCLSRNVYEKHRI
jgi:transcriptional regulator with XRE-family HTH domain